MHVDIDDRLRMTPKPTRAPAPLGELQSSGEIRLLILDDDPATCAVIQAALSNRDFQIDTVSDPMLIESVLSRKSHYHLIIMDYVIPGLEPDQVFGWVRDNQPEANIVVVTGYPSVDSALNCLRERTGVSLGYLSQIELGKNSASIETLYRICLALGIKMSELFTAVQRH